MNSTSNSRSESDLSCGICRTHHPVDPRLSSIKASLTGRMTGIPSAYLFEKFTISLTYGFVPLCFSGLKD